MKDVDPYGSAAMLVVVSLIIALLLLVPGLVLAYWPAIVVGIVLLVPLFIALAKL